MASPGDKLIIPDVHYEQYGNLTDKEDVAMAGFELPRMGNMSIPVDSMDRLTSAMTQALGKDVDVKFFFKPDGDSKPYAEVYIRNRGWNPEESEIGQSPASKAIKERLKAIVEMIQLTVVEIVQMEWTTGRLEQLNRKYCTDRRAGSENKPALGNDTRAEGGYVESEDFKKLNSRDVQQEPHSSTEAGERKKDADELMKRKEDEMPDAFSSENVMKRSMLALRVPQISDCNLDDDDNTSGRREIQLTWMTRAAEAFNNLLQQQTDNRRGSEVIEDKHDENQGSCSPGIASGFSAPSSACYSPTSRMGGSPKSPPKMPDSPQYPGSPLIKE